MMKYSIDPEVLTGEAISLTLLSKALFSEPERAWVDGLIHEQIFAEVPFGADHDETKKGLDLLQQWSVGYPNGITDECFFELKQDYNALFIGTEVPMPVPAWESVYLNREHLVFQEETRQVREFYKRFNIEPEKIYQEPDDHIALELLFLARLAQLALAALEQGDNEGADNLLQVQADFLSQHLLRWGLKWADGMITYAKTDYYRGLGQLSRGFIMTLVDLFELKLPKEANR